MRKDLQIELKVFGLYSTAAKELGCTSAEVDEVYSWYIGEIVGALKKTETKQIYLRGLGMFRANPACIPNILYYNIVRHRDMAEFMVKFPKYHTKTRAGFMLEIYNSYKKLYEQGLEKMEILLKEPIFDKPMYYKQRQRLIDFQQNRLDQLYESICRLHELAEAGSKERGQDNRGNQHQDIERIQFTK
jgi:hypothetical protein